jgi:acyl carrier protein
MIKKIVEILNSIKPLGEIKDIENFRYLDNHLDSFSIIHFIMALEEEFGIKLEPEDTESEEFRTIGGVAKIIRRKI